MQKHEQRWLDKARRDLLLARACLMYDVEALDSAIYHTQQCAEKALKAYLRFRREPVRKTHDLEVLLKLCATYDPVFMDFFEHAVFLNPMSTYFRYPDEYADEDEQPDRVIMQQAIKFAEQMLAFVEQLIGP